MKRRCKTEAKIDLEEEEDRIKSMAFGCSSDDDEEANKDLSLEIVEKARKREEKRKREEDFGGSNRREGIIDISSLSPSHGSAFIDLGGDAEDLSVEIVENGWKFESKRKREGDLGGSEQRSFKNDEVIDLDSLSPSDEVELISTGEDGAEGEQKKKNPKKKMRWRKKKREKAIEEEKNFINNINTEESSVTVEAVRTDAVEVFDNDMKAEENFVAVEDVDVEGINLLDNVVNVEALEATESTVPEAIGTSDNAILRKLLRGPRYFDPPDGNWGTCYNCGKEGHTIANCTEEKRKKPCFVCGKFGHGAKNCTQGQDCYLCKRRGHIAKNCPEKHQQSSQSFKICLRCGDLGHDMSSCGNDYSLEDLKEIQCYICKCFGHLCCANIIDNGPREVSCYNCGRSGHTGVGCAKARWEASSAASPTICYRCGEEGHFARGCNKSKSGQWNGEPSTPSQRFFKARKKAGFRSVPHDVGERIQKNKRTPNSERKYMTTGKSKQRGGWITDDPGDLPNRRGKVNGWMSPATPDGKVHSAVGRFSSSQSSLRKPKGRFGTPSSHDSPKPSMHKFSASRFSNSKGHYWRAHD
eukprot:TRINITY_DN1407_c0_g2_i2.p1 TRINITY_DN1407_c0_g2~~TRINITY_DN1407_c0_g2_i2.p1  ORF type:complete len:583 (-),score=135.46 TRINITY_DN1407_c0_g2_i2:529-2277(-)